MAKSSQPGLVSARSIRSAIVPAIVASIFFGLVHHFVLGSHWRTSAGFALAMGLVVFVVYAFMIRRR